MIPKHIIDRIRNEANAHIVDIISEHVELKPAGSSMKAKCPFHEENTPSFSVSGPKGIYKCFGGCGARGDAVNFLIEYTGQSFVEVIKQLANRFHIDIPKDKNYTSPKPDQPSVYNVLDRYQKADIRKAGFAFLVFDKTEMETITSKNRQPVILVSNPLKQLEAKALIKCTSNFVLKADTGRISTDNFWVSVQQILSCQTHKTGPIDIMIQPASAVPAVTKQNYTNSLDYGYLKDWLSHAIDHTQQNEWLRKQLVRTIASIPDKLTRRIYKNHFFDRWEKKLTL